jgi:hypothetical protein
MCVAGYLAGKRFRELRMPKSGELGDALSIRSEGPVMRGQKSVEEQRRVDAIRAASSEEPFGGKTYETVDDYDPVLRSHCRL